MAFSRQFVSTVRSEFEDNRLTFQHEVPVFHPESAEEAARVIQLANSHRQPLFISGSESNVNADGPQFAKLVVVKTDRLGTRFDAAPDDFYVTLGAGFALNGINARLKNLNLCLPHADLPYRGSIGGAVAVGLSAEHDGHDLPLRRYFVKARVATPQGEIIEPGSACFKSVSGYDIVKIFANSWGLLGLIVSATFRVMPIASAAPLASMRMKTIDRRDFLATIGEGNTAADAVYTRKIKAKFDPQHVFPIV